MKRVRVIVTGGPTRAYLDEVRYLSNYSSGELAYQTCSELKRRGVEVAAVIGPTSFDFQKLGLKQLSSVLTSDQMHQEVLRLCKQFRPHWVVFAAAVLDFVPAKKQTGKVSSKRKSWTIRLKPAPKTIDMVGQKYPVIQRVGFKLEWKKPREGATAWGWTHLDRRDLEALVLNYLPEISGRAHPAHLFRRGEKKPKVVSSKKQIARQIALWVAATQITAPPQSRTR